MRGGYAIARVAAAARACSRGESWFMEIRATFGSDRSNREPGHVRESSSTWVVAKKRWVRRWKWEKGRKVEEKGERKEKKEKGFFGFLDF